METSPLPRPEEGPFQIRRKKTPPDEDAGLQGGASGSEGGGKHVEKAVLELTKIAKTLTASLRDSKPDLEALLGYGLLGDRSEACSSGSSRRNSAALAALRRAVRESPALIYEPMERTFARRCRENLKDRPPRGHGCKHTRESRTSPIMCGGCGSSLPCGIGIGCPKRGPE